MTIALLSLALFAVGAVFVALEVRRTIRFYTEGDVE